MYSSFLVLIFIYLVIRAYFIILPQDSLRGSLEKERLLFDYEVVSYSPSCSGRGVTNQTFVSLCAIAKYEDIYIQEYIDYYTALGFCGFYFFDNSDEFTLRNVIHNSSVHGDAPLITLIHTPGRAMQMKAYHACIQHSMRDSFTLAAFFDLDEFLVLKNHSNITSFIQDHGATGGHRCELAHLWLQ